MSCQLSAFFGGGFLHRSGRDRFEIFLKGVVVRLKLARLVDELLALRSVVGFGFWCRFFFHRCHLVRRKYLAVGSLGLSDLLRRSRISFSTNPSKIFFAVRQPT